MPPDTALTFSCAMRVVASVKKPDILFNSLRIKPDQAATSVAATPELPRSFSEALLFRNRDRSGHCFQLHLLARFVTLLPA